jgi:hypothetical protein
MNRDSENVFLERVKQQLDQHAEALDEVTAARLKSARTRALDAGSRSRMGWLPMTGLATAAAALLAVVIWNQLPGDDSVMPGEWDMLATSEELELIDELDFYAWLEETEASG